MVVAELTGAAHAEGHCCGCSVSAGSGPLSEEEMDAHTVRAMREAAQSQGKPHRRLVWLTPGCSLHDVIVRLFETRSSMAPVLSSDPEGELVSRHSLR